MKSKRDVGAELCETWFRGGYVEGWQAALDALRMLLQQLEAHEEKLEEWSNDDPTLATPAPAWGELE